MDQHPKVTLAWALRCLERALQDLGDGVAERRVRRQFHQFLLAIERDSRSDESLVYRDDAEPAQIRVAAQVPPPSKAQTGA